MTGTYSSALSDYAPAFRNEQEPFLFFYSLGREGSHSVARFTRGEFWSLARKAASVIAGNGLGKGSRIAHCFSANHPYDLVFRLAGAMTGAVPVTINWQADTRERILYKIELTGTRLVLTDSGFDKGHLQAVKGRFPDIPVFPVGGLPQENELPEDHFCADLGPEESRMVIFTSGTTGEPKGVELPYRAYRVNRLTFESFLEIRPHDRFSVLIVNPFHHSNSSAITDWAMRRPGTHIHLIERYSTDYWGILCEAVFRGYDRLVAPTVSRHFDFLENLARENRLPVDLELLKRAMTRTDFLIGSAPVGPTTIQRLRDYAGRLPVVRFGSTETCLQVIGTPLCLSEENRMRAFVRGWERTEKGEARPGYYIGRPHPPHTEARIVRAIQPGRQGFMTDCAPGEAGYLITRGGNLMSGYVHDPAGTREAFQDGWYLGLKDVCFSLENEEDGREDYYWVSRESTLLIRGGANYAYDQISAELTAFASAHYHLPPESFEIAVVGLKVGSEHEDSCCVTIELRDEAARLKQSDMERTFKTEALRHVSKGAKPDYVRFASIPRNFKGAVMVNELAAEFREWLRRQKPNECS
ncbi:MAG: class I adenylate-forming enzyme family protein [Thermodesulfobacteriota bacterium]